VGAARVVVGARSALFAPLAGLALIVVDEEHDAGYKQEETPRYHARDLALVRGRETGAVVVLGSATPSMEAWNLAEEGRADLLRLPERATGGRLAEIELVDMRQEFRETKADRPLSRRLVVALQEVLARGEQAMILLNRRGYTRAVLCRACGEPIACPACSIALTWHRVGEKLRCHYCGHARARPAGCPTCSSPHLADVGSGTQLAEQALAEALPGARIARLDRDAVRSGARLAALLGGFARGAYDVMVGTQMIAKGHHFPRVTLVGVLSADAALRMPDFRAAERTFQLLTQVAGRAGRGNRPGRVLVQAFRPDHPALSSLVHQDFEAFAGKFPRRGRSGAIDWEEAEARGLIRPVDHVEGVSIRRAPLKMDKEVSIESSGWMADVIFSHRKHSVWNGCEVCHPEIYPSTKSGTKKTSMLEISSGRSCGTCHVSVAFPLADCERCHVKPVR
jgi:primosomal protein N' (replication factor Y)